MNTYRVLLGIDRAARDTGKRLIMIVGGASPLDAGLAAERLADTRLEEPELEYTHAMQIATIQPASIVALAA